MIFANNRNNHESSSEFGTLHDEDLNINYDLIKEEPLSNNI